MTARICKGGSTTRTLLWGKGVANWELSRVTSVSKSSATAQGLDLIPVQGSRGGRTRKLAGLPVLSTNFAARPSTKQIPRALNARWPN